MALRPPPALLLAALTALACKPADGDTTTATATATETGTGTGTETETDGDTDGLASYAGGDRLRPVVWQPESGEPGRFDWHDSELDQRCEFVELADGALHCVPETFEAPARFFADAACTQRAQPLGDVDPPYPAHAWSPAGAGSCAEPATRVIHPVSGGVESGVLYEVDEIDGCVAASPDPADFLPVGAPIDPATYVAATDAIVDGSARILGVKRLADDGSWSYVAAHDSALATAADHYRTSDGLRRWLPKDGVNFNRQYYGDAACTAPVGGGPAACADPSEAYVNDRTPSECGELRSVYGGGPEIAGPVYRKMGMTCEEATVTDFHFYPVGAPIADAEFAEAILETVGDGQILRRFWTADGSPRIGDEGFIDTAHDDASCSPRDDRDGVTRCLPNALITFASFTYYTTPDCSGTRIGLVPACLGPIPPYGSVHDEGCDCYDVYSFGADIDPAGVQLYRDNGMGCQPTQDAGPDYRYVELAPMDPIEWAALEEVVL